MNTSEQINEVATALAKAQGEIVNPAKDAENPHFRSRYADLASGLNAVRPILAKHGLSVVQMTRMDGDLMALDTRLLHSSGQWMESTYPVCRFPAKQQEVGSALTYSRRYSLFAMVGIAGEDEDDDGNEASKTPTPAPQRPTLAPVERAAPAMRKAESFDAAEKMIDTLALCDSVESLKEWAKVNKPEKDRMTTDDQNRVMASYLNKMNLVKTYPQAAE